MSKEFDINDELAAVETALKSLQPVAESIARDRLMFLAGRASLSIPVPPTARRPARWLWPVTTATSLMLALGFGGLFFLRPCRVEKEIVYVEANEPSTGVKTPQKLWYDNVKAETVAADRPKPPPGMEGMDYLSLSRLVATKGVEALPSPKIDAAAPRDLPRGRPMTLRDWETILND